MRSPPKISVLLPVHNARSFLEQTLRSLAAQTLRDFEVVAVDDGSADGSGDILDTFARTHDWLRVFRQDCTGVAGALNRAFAESHGAWLARIDADDLAAPERLAKQAEFLDDHPEIGVCGSFFRTFGAAGSHVVRVPETDDAIRARLVFGSAFAHPAVMMRRETLRVVHGPYDPRHVGAEDYDLWLRLAGHTRFGNLPQVLLQYRTHSAQVTRRDPTARNAVIASLWRDLWRRLRVDCADGADRAHLASSFEQWIGAPLKTGEVHAWLMRLRSAVPAAGWCGQPAFERELTEAWWRAIRRTDASERRAAAYLRSPLVRPTPRNLWRALRLVRQPAA